MKFLEIYQNDKSFYDDFEKKLGTYKSGHRKNENFEDLFFHSQLVTEFFIKFCKERQLDSIFEKISNNFESISKEKLKRDILRIVFLHDIGKMNPLAQEYYQGKLNKNQGNTGHADFSVIISLNIFFEDITSLKDLDVKEEVNDKVRYALFLFCLIYSARLHHGHLGKITNFRKMDEEVKKILKESEKEIEHLLKNIGIRENFYELKEIHLKGNLFEINFKEDLFLYMKFFFSCLTMSDYYATYCYQFDCKKEEIKINQINKDLIKKFENNFYERSFNKKLKDSNKLRIKSLRECSSLDSLRDNLIIQSSNTLNNSLDENKKIFMLNVPTGGGKTNISLKLVLDILNKDSSINRVNWVFPFVNLIDQNYKVIKDTYFGKENSKEYLSKISYKSIDIDSEEWIDYEKNFKQLMEQDLNLSYLNNPINVISNVNFFDSFFKTRKQNRYKFANFTNSIVVLDEIQSINHKYLNIFYKMLKKISENYNIYFIIMSATLPDLNKYNEEEIANDLIKDYPEYFNHIVFKRNEFIFENSKFDERSLLEYLKEKILVSHAQKNKFLIVVNTINSSVELFNSFRMESSPLSQYKIFLLNSFVEDKSRLKIIDFIKKSNEKIILISTQSIEAGVDLDFDIGFRDNAILDSIEQVAGRINRECKKENSKLYVMNFKNDANKIYKKDLRYNLDFKSNEKLAILNTKKFVDYYDKYFNKIKEYLEGALEVDYFKEIGEFNFDKIQKLNLIENRPSIDLFPSEIIKENLDEESLKFINKKNCKTILDLVKLLENKNGFEYKPLFNLISKIKSLNSLNLDFFNEFDLQKFISFLNSNGYVLQEGKLNDYSFILNKTFFDKYILNYGYENNNFSYLNYPQLKEDLKLSNEESFFA